MGIANDRRAKQAGRKCTTWQAGGQRASRALRECASFLRSAFCLCYSFCCVLSLPSRSLLRSKYAFLHQFVLCGARMWVCVLDWLTGACYTGNNYSIDNPGSAPARLFYAQGAERVVKIQ